MPRRRSKSQDSTVCRCRSGCSQLPTSVNSHDAAGWQVSQAGPGREHCVPCAVRTADRPGSRPVVRRREEPRRVDRDLQRVWGPSFPAPVRGWLPVPIAKNLGRRRARPNRGSTVHPLVGSPLRSSPAALLALYFWPALVQLGNPVPCRCPARGLSSLRETRDKLRRPLDHMGHADNTSRRGSV
jgi:hypothetical protein